MEAQRVRRAASLVFSDQQVSTAVAAMAAGVGARLADRDPVIVAVMQGGAFTAVHLCAHFDFPFEFDYVHVTRYGDDIVGGDLEWRAAPQIDLRGRTVLLVDDVLDHGVTLAALRENIEARDPAELLVAVLVRKQLAAARQRPRPDFVGLESEDVYLFGCGMDYKGYWRGLPAIYAVAEA